MKLETNVKRHCICVESKILRKWTYLQNRLTDKRLVTKAVRGRGKLGAWDQRMHTALCKVDEQQGPTVRHRELPSKPYNNLLWKRNGKWTHMRVYMYMYKTESLCYIDMWNEINDNKKKNQVIKILKCADINIKSFEGKAFLF